ncbi:NUDIX hydrolase [Pseudopedobacter saltans DSM 12145]|uniref:NUDIX hydrolase n=1 Tax=Pseudopedobacter saltans (strain ATCC 51119 / DSM 12145 / JCM 21818 / CCUG 39354 / LMG 10337 / NBRC 100064 / NCIMB 13643) TaxID=762903 RepID=F0S936_PSESL|nr:NUDIX domain-containing protein [Pseudopedobacter saltans]ADY51334.1 NUDIX hydrolase [Pseudopedobacter saltans DSM 12145]
MKNFNVRVYGLLINEENQILITDEEIKGFRFTKFPGGGLELGEGTIEGLKREFLEECNLEIAVLSHFYTTDFFVKSLFSEEQLLSIYYLVKPLDKFKFKISLEAFDFDSQAEGQKQAFRLVFVDELEDKDLTFPVDKHVLKLLKSKR